MITLLALIISLLYSTYATSPYFYDYNHYFRFHWKGAVQPTSIHFKVFPNITSIGNLKTFIVIYTNSSGVRELVPSSLSTAITFEPHQYPISELTMTGLTAKTQYYYTFVLTEDAAIDSNTFQASYSSSVQDEFGFRTFEVALTPYNFTFGASSCSLTRSQSVVFLNMTDENFDFFLHMGDFQYEDIGLNNESLFYEAYYTSMASPTRKKFFQSTPLYYNWDDHDFGPNDANGNIPSRPAVTAVFKRAAPTPASILKNYLPAGVVNPNDGTYVSYHTDGLGIFRSYIVGRCFFIQLDLRTWNDVLPGNLLGEEQRDWFENQVKYAARTPQIKMVFLISSVPWIATEPGSMWENFQVEQEWMGGLITREIYGNQKEAMVISGDAHMLAFDDGRNNRNGRFPVAQAACLDRAPSCKGGPYSHGIFQGNGQYGSFQVIDDVGSTRVCVNVELKRFGVNMIVYNTCHPENYPASDNNHCSSPTPAPSPAVTAAKPTIQAIEATQNSHAEIYIIVFGSLLVIICVGLATYWFRRMKLRKRTGVLKKQAENAKSTDASPIEKHPINIELPGDESPFNAQGHKLD